MDRCVWIGKQWFAEHPLWAVTAVKQCEEVADHVADKSRRPCSGAGRGKERRRRCGWPILANMWDRLAQGIFGRTLCIPESLMACALFKRPFRCVVSHHAFAAVQQFILCTCGQGLIDGLQQLSHSPLFRNLPQRLHQCFCQPSMSSNCFTPVLRNSKSWKLQ